ncbi:MAG: YraN family protein [Nitrospirota bacterium]|nr:YraN family protein [Nitrospirota bacterium]MDH5768814.1 YraN family protein [Nitrospirota bacterium]
MKALGTKGENLAVTFLKKKGYKIIARNYKTFIGEIDIIAKDGNTTVFIEVKTRTNDSFGYPFEAVNNKKKQKLKKLALLYLKSKGQESPIRFDVLSIFYMDNGKGAIEHITDAFEF